MVSKHHSNQNNAKIDDSTKPFTGENLRFLRVTIYNEMSQAEFGKRLAAMAGKPPYSRGYISSLESGRMEITEEIHLAALALYALNQTEDRPEFVTTKIKAHPGQIKPGSLFEGESTLCRHPDCDNHFIKTGPNQRQCPACKRERK